MSNDVRLAVILATLCAQGCAPSPPASPADVGSDDAAPRPDDAPAREDVPQSAIDATIDRPQEPPHDAPADDAPDRAPLFDAPDVTDATDATDATVVAPDVPPVDVPSRDVGFDASDAPDVLDAPDAHLAVDVMDVVDAPAIIDVFAPRDAPTSLDVPTTPDGGAPGAWELVGDFASGLWQWGHFLTVARDGTLYLARANTGVYRGVPRGSGYAWDLLPNTGLTNLAFSAVAVNDLGEPLLGCAGPMYGATGPGTLFRFNPTTSAWSAAVVPAPGYTRNVTDFLVTADGSIYVTGGWAALLLRSTDGGSTYTVRTNFDAIRPGTYYGLLFSVELGPGNEMIVGAETESFQHSFDEGRMFTPLDTATWLQRGNPYGAGFTQSGEGLFSRAIDADSTKIYRRARAGGWVRADTGLERDPINTAPANGWVNNIVLAPWGENFIATLTSVYRSRDGGPWTPFMTGIATATYGPYPNVIVADARCVYVGVRPVAPRTDIGAVYRYCGR